MRKDNLTKVIKEYEFARKQGFKNIVIVIVTQKGEYRITETEEGFLTDEFPYAYKIFAEIAEDLMKNIEEEIEEMRIE